MSSQPQLFKMQKMEARTLHWWRARRDRIDVEPSYQRKGRRWSVSDKQYLIDSILNGFDIPKFYVADFTWGNSKLNEKKLEYAVIDGKQRFEAIFEFFDNEFPLAKDFFFVRDERLKLGGLTYSELKLDYPDIAEIFDNFNLDVMGVISSETDYVEELFVRLNRSKPLSGAEVRNAMTGELSQIIRNIRDHEFFTSNIKFNTSRGQDLNCAAKIFMFEVTGTFQETKKTSLDRFVETNSYSNKKIKDSVTSIVQTLGRMSQVFQFKDFLLRSEGPVPVYYWLFRHSSAEVVPYIRDFLDWFHLQLVFPVGDILSTEDWHIYKIASRSVNDRRSHSTRYLILKRTFARWLATQR